MPKRTMALFGEAEKGEFRHAHLLESLPQLVDLLGQPPAMSQGLHIAVQALMYQRTLLFFRVREEGYSVQDYYCGLKILKERQQFHELAALCMPGVGDEGIIKACSALCLIHHSILITNEQDLYDYLTQQPRQLKS